MGEMNKILTKRQAIDILLEEYPQLKDRGLMVLKQFKSLDGREYNTFLIETTEGKYVAKGNVYDVANLSLEKYFLDILQNSQCSPSLIFPEITPKTFLIMSYIDGSDANSLLQSSSVEKQKEIFTSIGKTLKKVHSVNVKCFGNPLKKDSEDYFKDLQDKLTGRLSFAKKHLSGTESQLLESLLADCKEVVKKDCTNKPVITHRDIYVDNFIIQKSTEKAVLIDFAMARGGRPFYDLGKFYIADISRYPECHESFLEGYGESLQSNEYNSLVVFSVILELTGQLGWFKSINDKIHFERSLKFLKEISKKEGVLWELLS